MTNRDDLLEHAVELFPAPDQALEHLKRRHRRQQRNRRLAAGGVGLAIASPSWPVPISPPARRRPCRPTPSTPSSTTTVEDGRVLFVIYHGHRSDPAYIDATGVHPLGSYVAANFFHLVWASPTEIIYDGRGTGERHLYRMSIDGTDVTQLTHGPTSQQNPAVSPDGSTVVYEQYDEVTKQEMGLYLADATTGADARPLLPSGGARAPGHDTSATFSPDGEWIAFVRVSDVGEGAAALYIVRTDGTGLRRLVDGSYEVGYPRWSPDGRTILFTQGGTFVGLATVAVEGGAPQSFTGHGPDGGTAFEGDWSPDGTQIVFKYWESWMSFNELRIINADGSDERTIWTGEDGFTAETPDWGP